MTSQWQKVVFAGELEDCEACEEKWCGQCNEHYFECGCPGPSQEDEYDYEEREDGLYAKPKEANALTRPQ